MLRRPRRTRTRLPLRFPTCRLQLKQAVGAIHEITHTISRMSDVIASAIATAVEEQDVTTKEISRNVIEAAERKHLLSPSSITDVSSGASETGRPPRRSCVVGQAGCRRKARKPPPGGRDVHPNRASSVRSDLLRMNGVVLQTLLPFFVLPEVTHRITARQSVAGLRMSAALLMLSCVQPATGSLRFGRCRWSACCRHAESKV